MALNDEQKKRIQAAQASLAMEGFPVEDHRALEIGRRYFESGRPEKLAAANLRADMTFEEIQAELRRVGLPLDDSSA